MSYIGNTPTQQGFVPAIDYFSGNGTQTDFPLSRPVASVAQVQVVVENVPQKPGDAFTVVGNTLKFTGAIPIGTNNAYVYYTSPITQVIQPGQGTVTTATLVDGNVTYAKMQSVTAGKVLGRDTSGSGAVQELPIGVDTNGNVLMGTALQYGTAKLSVNGAINVPDDLFVGAGIGAGSGASIQFKSGASGYLSFLVNGNGRAQISAGGQRQSTIIGGGGGLWNAYDCRAWVNFYGVGSTSINGSANISSITRSSAGSYVVNFAAAMPDTGYSAVASAENGSGYSYMIASTIYYATTNVQVVTAQPSGALADVRTCSLAIFR
jgi:hypothetical protein